MNAVNIDVNINSSVPIYKQIVDSIVKNVSEGKLKPGEKLPSINSVSRQYRFSRDTVEKAYKILRDKKVIEAIKGKGSYVSNIFSNKGLNILFMINKPSSYKFQIFDSFMNEIGVRGHVAMVLYYCDETLFVNELERRIGSFDHYVIMPHFRDQQSRHISYTSDVINSINKIPGERLTILDHKSFPLDGEFSSVYQDFESDITESLSQAIEKLKKYDKLVLVFPVQAHYPFPKRIFDGFINFCQENNFVSEIIGGIYEDMDLDKKHAYIVLRESDLVKLVRQVREKNITLGKDMGIISYNETPLKELLGITVISTDFKTMGYHAANLILENRKEMVKNVFKYIERDSL